MKQTAPTPGSLIDPASPLWRRVLALHALGCHYASGATLADCAQERGMCLKTIAYRLEILGIPRRRTGPPCGDRSPARTKEIRALRRGGMTLAEIGFRFNLTRQRVHHLVTRKAEGKA